MTIPSWLEAGAHEIVSPLGAGGMVVRLAPRQIGPRGSRCSGPQPAPDPFYDASP